MSISTFNKQPYLFNGKELDFETGLYYYGARYYDPKVSIFLNVDPLAEKYPHISPYTYVANNPINAIDPDGREPEDDHFNKYGKFLYRDNKSTNNIIVHIGKEEYKLSQLDYNKKGTLKAVSNVLAHYAGEKGMKEYVGVGAFEKGSAYANAYDNIFFNTKALDKGIYDNIYNVKSTLNHEIGHINEPTLDPYTFEQHANIYLAEASHPDFTKTTQAYSRSGTQFYTESFKCRGQRK